MELVLAPLTALYNYRGVATRVIVFLSLSLALPESRRLLLGFDGVFPWSVLPWD